MTTVRRMAARVLVKRMLVGSLIALACTEPRIRQAAPVSRVTGDEIGVDLSASNADESRGGMVVLSARAFAARGPLDIASYTVAISYDTAAATFLGASFVGGNVVAAVNPTAGLVRAAAFATTGFQDGELFRLEFELRSPDGLASLRVKFEEMHGTHHEDFRSRLRVLPVSGAPLRFGS